jgi:hypothetical protein
MLACGVRLRGIGGFGIGLQLRRQRQRKDDGGRRE